MEEPFCLNVIASKINDDFSREIRILQLLNHDNIVNLIEICRQYSRHKTTFYLVFDFCEHDLAGLLSNINVKFSLGEIKKVMQQMCEGLFFIHTNKIIHRDMKAANILITKTGTLKLADFGLARAISINKAGQANRYTNRVVTLWYRPPELLLGERNYGPAVDMWGAGCIMAEMWTRSPIMQGNTDHYQVTLITQLCGLPAPRRDPTWSPWTCSTRSRSRDPKRSEEAGQGETQALREGPVRL